MRLTALVVAAGLLWPISVLSETTTHDTIIFVLGRTFLAFALIVPLTLRTKKQSPKRVARGFLSACLRDYRLVCSSMNTTE
jgi:hypothetical protein